MPGSKPGRPTRNAAGIASGAGVWKRGEGNVAYNRGASIAKRERERARQQRQKEKAERRAQRATEKLEKPASESDVDPDIAGIVPGPQPRQEGD